MAAKKDNNVIQIKELKTKTVIIKLVGDSDLVLNKMNDSTTREMTADDRKEAHRIESEREKDHAEWEDAISALHWRDPRPYKDYTECTEEMFMDMLLKSNAPCISAHGLKESWKAAVVRMGLDTYSTKFDFQVDIKKLLLPIKFVTYNRDIKPMPQKGLGGGMLTAKLSRFSGWTCEVPVTYIMSGVYNESTIFSVISAAGFGLGIGSGTKSGYGRYHIENA